MLNILIFGAGKSSVYFIHQVQDYCKAHSTFLTIAALDFENLPPTIKKNKKTTFLELDIKDTPKIKKIVEQNDIVVSLLPPNLHLGIAQRCLENKKHFITASYVSEALAALHNKVKNAGLIFLNEVGVDPGLDHISALTLLDKIKEDPTKIISFKSHTGGIPAIKSNDNLWNYHITWNPKNVVLAGSEGAIFLENNTFKKTPYKDIFSTLETITVQNETYESYPNRDSLKYLKKYHIDHVSDCYRGTLRHKGFCEAWDILIKLGITNNQYSLQLKEEANRMDFFLHFIKEKNTPQNLKLYFKKYLATIGANPNILQKFEQLGFFDSTKKLKVATGSPATILQSIIEEEWKPKSNDMLIMLHEVTYKKEGQLHKATCSLKILGENGYYTAMAKTVGATLFEALLLVINHKITEKGVLIPTNKKIYPLLYQKIKAHGIEFQFKV